MLYNILRSIVKLSLKIYFRKITTKGLENIPKEGPFLLVSNHPSGYFDPLCICSIVNHKISFLAKASLFSTKIQTAFFKNLNIVPVYRAQDDPNNMSKNDEMFVACYDKLAKKGVILIFPEGTSKSERRLGGVKTGAARIALGATSITNHKIRVIPVGLNYSNSRKFRSKLSIEFGIPLECDDYLDNYQKDNTQTVKDLTADIEEAIKDLVINIERRESEELVRKVEKLISQKIIENNETDFVLATQNIYEAIIYFQENNKKLYDETKKKIDDYFLNLEEMNIEDRSLKNISEIENIWKYLFKTFAFIILGFPVWLFGIVHAYPPYKFTKSIVPKITDREEFFGVFSLMIGIISFILIYIFYLVLSWLIFHSLIVTLLYLISLPITAVFCIFYSRTARKLYYNLKLSSKIFSSQGVLAEIISSRNEILDDIKKIKTEYEKRERIQV